jgi:hypothetical protein
MTCLIETFAAFNFIPGTGLRLTLPSPSPLIQRKYFHFQVLSQCFSFQSDRKKTSTMFFIQNGNVNKTTSPMKSFSLSLHSLNLEIQNSKVEKGKNR